MRRTDDNERVTTVVLVNANLGSGVRGEHEASRLAGDALEVGPGQERRKEQPHVGGAVVSYRDDYVGLIALVRNARRITSGEKRYDDGQQQRRKRGPPL